MKDFKKYIPWAIAFLLLLAVVTFLYLNRNPAIDNKKITVPAKEPKKSTGGGSGGGSSQSSGQQGPPASAPATRAPIVGDTIVAKYDGVKAYKSYTDSDLASGYGISTTVDHIAKTNEYLGSVELVERGMYMIGTASGKKLWVSAIGTKRI